MDKVINFEEAKSKKDEDAKSEELKAAQANATAMQELAKDSLTNGRPLLIVTHTKEGGVVMRTTEDATATHMMLSLGAQLLMNQVIGK